MAVTSQDIQNLVNSQQQTLNGIDSLIDAVSKMTGTGGSSGAPGTKAASNSGNMESRAKSYRDEERARKSITQTLEDGSKTIGGSFTAIGTAMSDASSKVNSGSGGVKASFDVVTAAGGSVATTMGVFKDHFMENTETGKRFGKRLDEGSKGLQRFAFGLRLSLGIATAAISLLVNAVSNSYDAFSEMSKAGATFGSELAVLRETAHSTGLRVEEFGKYVTKNISALTQLGGSASEGAKRVASVGSAIIQTGLDRSFLAMGMGAQEQLETAQNYMDILSRTGQLQQMSTMQIAQQTAGYAKDLKLLSELTGESADEMQKQMDKQKANAAFQASLLGMDADERAKVMQTESMITQKYGEAAGQAYREQIAFGGAMTEGTAQLQAFQPALAGIIQSTADGREDFVQFTKRIADAGPELEADLANIADIVKFGMVGNDGVIKAMGDAFLSGQEAVITARNTNVESLDKLRESIGNGDVEMQAAVTTQKALRDIMMSLRDVLDDIMRNVFNQENLNSLKSFMDSIVPLASGIGKFIGANPMLFAAGAGALAIAPSILSLLLGGKMLATGIAATAATSAAAAGGGLLTAAGGGLMATLAGAALPALAAAAATAYGVNNLYQGVTGGIDRYKETGSIWEGVKGGAGSFGSALTFGLFDDDEEEAANENGMVTKPIPVDTSSGAVAVPQIPEMSVEELTRQQNRLLKELLDVNIEIRNAI